MEIPQQFQKLRELEDGNLDLESLWITYLWLKDKDVFPHYEFDATFVWDINKIPKNKRDRVRDTVSRKFVYAGNDKLAKELGIHFREKLKMSKKKEQCLQYIEIIENHLKPILMNTGIYGIYEEDQLLYVGIAEQSFEKVQENMKSSFGDKAEMRVLVDIGRLGSMRVDKRDLWAMKYAAIQILKPQME